MDLPEMRRRLVAARVACLGTVDLQGRAHLVPCVFALDGDTVFTPVDGKPKRTSRLQRLRNLDAEPRATLLVDYYDEDWGRTWWVRIRGRGRLVDAPAATRAIELLRAKYPQYRHQIGIDAIIAIEIEDWYGWAYTTGE